MVPPDTSCNGLFRCQALSIVLPMEMLPYLLWILLGILFALGSYLAVGLWRLIFFDADKVAEAIVDVLDHD